MLNVNTNKKKLIEVALPLEAINKASVREKSIRHGHPSTMHLWWARRPLATARAVIFAQLVDDPSSHPDLFPTEKEQEEERNKLFRIIEDLVQWENISNEEVLRAARDKILESWRRTCEDNVDCPQANELFNPDKLPSFHDPFSGGGSLPLEAQRLGLETIATDLNPVAVLINKALIEIPPKFAGMPPVNPKSRVQGALRVWRGAEGLAEDVRYYGQQLRDEAERLIGHLYPKVKITEEMTQDRPDLKPYVGREFTVIAWLWARTVKSPNPAFAHVDVPLVSNFLLSTKQGNEAYVEPVIDGDNYRFVVKAGMPKNPEVARLGTTAGKRSGFRCLMSGVPITYDYIRKAGRAKQIGLKLMAVVADGEHGRLYLSPTPMMEKVALGARPEWLPDTEIPYNPRDFKPPNYGFTSFGDLFTSRQLVALTTFADLVQTMKTIIMKDALSAGLADDGRALEVGGMGARAYAEAVCVYLGLAVSKETAFLVTQARWRANEGKSAPAFGRQALPMVWDFADLNPFAGAGGDFLGIVDGIAKALQNVPRSVNGTARQANASAQIYSSNCLVSTDPPYYDNIVYADLADYFYVWLRRMLKSTYPDLFATLAVPKSEELVAAPYRHGSKEKAERFFLDGMTQALSRIAEQSHPAFPVTIYYAFKQTESHKDDGTASTGWETFLDAVIKAGFSITGTWPMRTENHTRLVGLVTNALASSIVLVCRKRSQSAPAATRREFLTALKTELPKALSYLRRSNIAPVDLAQAAIGPGMAVFTRYARILDSEGKELTVRDALALINQVLDEILTDQEGDFDADTRWAVSWFEQYGFDDGEYGVAETLSKAKNTSVDGMVDAGILRSKRGKVRLLRPAELPPDWSPTADKRLTGWEIVHYVIRALEQGGESQAADLVRQLGSRAEVARDLAYRLYTICERKKRAAEALSYNSLVQSWPEIVRLAQEGGAAKARQTTIFDNEEAE